MPRVGRRRESNFKLPSGTRERAGSWYWQPTTKRERDERRAKGLQISSTLGPAGSDEARRKWAEVTGLRESNPGTVGDLLNRFEAGPIKTQRNGKARSANTIRQYRWRLPALRERFGSSIYAKTEGEVLRGRALGAGAIQDFITESGSLGRAYLAILDHAFDNAILQNLTTYNPCDKVRALAGTARTREPLEWELECLGALASPVVALILGYKAISGYRISEVIGVHRRDMMADGISMTVKGGKHEKLLWSPTLRAIKEAAEALPNATPFPASPLFPNSRGKAYTYSGWHAAWVELKAATNAALVDVVDPDTLELHPALLIEDLHVHDVRSKVHDDAEDLGREGHEQLGNTERVADKHYARREKRRRPLR